MLQQYRDVRVRGVHEILRRSSLSATKAPQCERVINGLAMMPWGSSRLQKHNGGLCEIDGRMSETSLVYLVCLVYLVGLV